MNSSHTEEEQTLVTRYGPTEQRECMLELGPSGRSYWLEAAAGLRRGEVVMAVQRSDGSLLLHTKSHYPPGAYRLPTGGICAHEPVLNALSRELWEELGLQTMPTTMPGIIRYSLHHEEGSLSFASYLFVIQVNNDLHPQTQDASECISDFCWVHPSELVSVADNLRAIVRVWNGWGPFRAMAHDLLADVWNHK